MSEDTSQLERGRFEGQVLQSLMDIKKTLEDMTKRHDSIDGRVASLERWKAYMMGVAAALGVVGGFLGDKLSMILNK